MAAISFFNSETVDRSEVTITYIECTNFMHATQNINEKIEKDKEKVCSGRGLFGEMLCSTIVSSRTGITLPLLKDVFVSVIGGRAISFSIGIWATSGPISETFSGKNSGALAFECVFPNSTRGITKYGQVLEHQGGTYNVPEVDRDIVCIVMVKFGCLQ